MSKVIIWNLVSLDGYFEGEKKWDLDFHNHGWGEELEKLSKGFGASAACLVFGRITYEGMRDYWTTAEESEIKTFMNALPKLVASRTLTQANWNNTRITDRIVEEIRIEKQKAVPGKNIYVFGSADLSDSLLEAEIVDEVMLALVPGQLGKGTPFFKEREHARMFRLLEANPLKNGTLVLRYEPVRQD